MLSIIEIPKGNVLKIGGTTEHDFYIKIDGAVNIDCFEQLVITHINKIASRKNFEYSRQFMDFVKELYDML